MPLRTSRTLAAVTSISVVLFSSGGLGAFASVGSPSAGIASDGIASAGIASDGIASDGIASDGIASGGVASPGSASARSASLAGRVTTRSGLPLSRAVVMAADVKTETAFSSAETGATGAFALEALPAGTYDLAIKTEAGIYLVDGPVVLGKGETKRFTVAVNPQPTHRSLEEEGATGPAKGAVKSTTFWKNPLTISLLFLGTAAIVGVLISHNNQHDSRSASPSTP